MPEFVLEVPIDLSNVEDRQAGETVRVTAVTKGGVLVSETAEIGRSGKATVKLRFDEKPEGLRLHVGPGTAAAEDLPKLQSLEVPVPARRLADGPRASLEPIRIKPELWLLWRRWCRTFVVKGRITCPDGRPVAGAEVTAFDIDWWWWWVSKQAVGSAVTDQNGFYRIEFRWCCGWWPWWWWKLRHWRLEPGLIDRIRPILRLIPDLPEPPQPTPTPDPGVFERILADVDSPRFPRIDLGRLDRRERVGGRIGGGLGELPDRQIDPELITRLREPLLTRLPEVEELTRLKVWPWYPWGGWLDCAPDLVFRVTQDCGDQMGKVLIDEGILSTRWDVPQESVANLVAVDACCIDDTPQPEGDCLNLTHACGVPVSSIGGNPTAAAAAPVGYASPGSGDHPFAGVVWISGDFGTAADADYYELEWFDPAEPPASAWKPIPPGAMLGFTRQFFGPALPAGPTATHSVPFPVQEIGGRRVIETRQHFQQNNEPASWENLAHPEDRWWTNNKTLLAGWATDGFFADGTYRLRVRSWELVAPDTLDNDQVLAICGDDEPADEHELVLRVDNQIVTDTTAHGDPCGSGTVHTCTEEPETRILAVEILDSNGVKKADLDACSEVAIADDDKLRVRFRASDSDGHLSRYHMQVTFGENGKRVLIGSGAEPSFTHTGVGSAIVGETYSLAMSDPAATRPVWRGGDYELVGDAKDAFPITCCYQIELWAYKRTIVSCSGDHRNLSERSFMVRRP